ncbi:DUF4232 domain-containing protein [Streptomyces sp. NPDC007088]|uniref:DUF4232 domain-containing protein n=1 Tax=Streptomyces sp. NPDC007088 TaxID=3364773 RepID=UPI0036C1ECA5
MSPAPRRRPLTPIAALAAAALCLSGCTTWKNLDDAAAPATPVPTSSPHGLRPGPGGGSGTSPSAPACPSSGVRITADRGDAAMGLRVMSVWITNCGLERFRVGGYPELRLLGEDGADTGVGVLHGTDTISSGLSPDEPRGEVTLRRGERARTILAWRNTVTTGHPAPGVFLEVEPGAGLPAQRVRAEVPLDVGTAAVVGTSRWTKGTAPGAGTSVPEDDLRSAPPAT